MMSVLKFGFACLSCLTFSIPWATAATSDRDCVVLLHGLARTSTSMFRMESQLEKANFNVVNVNYPSRDSDVVKLAQDAVAQGIKDCEVLGFEKLHFVSHSLGGILIRIYFQDNKHDRLGRVVMLGPPNQGSELVDAMEDMPGFELLNGPSGPQLGTEAGDIPATLGPVNFEVGIIAGNHNWNPLYGLLIPGPDDGKVSIESTRVEGMSAHIVMPVTHTWMMFSNDVIEQVVHFLNTGKFITDPDNRQF